MVEALDSLSLPRYPRILQHPTREFAHLYLWIGCQWVAVEPKVDEDRVYSEGTDIAWIRLQESPYQSDATHPRSPRHDHPLQLALWSLASATMFGMPNSAHFESSEPCARLHSCLS